MYTSDIRCGSRCLLDGRLKGRVGIPVVEKEITDRVLIRGDIQIAIGLAFTRLHQIAELVLTVASSTPSIFKIGNEPLCAFRHCQKNGHLVLSSPCSHPRCAWLLPHHESRSIDRGP